MTAGPGETGDGRRMALAHRIGKEAPDFALPMPDGAPLLLSSLRGRNVVILFYCFDWSGT